MKINQYVLVSFFLQ